MSHCRDQAHTLTRRLMAMLVKPDFTMDKMEEVLEVEIYNAEQRGKFLATHAAHTPGDHTREVTSRLGGVPSEREIKLSVPRTGNEGANLPMMGDPYEVMDNDRRVGDQDSDLPL